MKQEYDSPAQVEALGRILRDMAVANGQPWDEYLYRQETLGPQRSSFACACRLGRGLEALPRWDRNSKRLLEFGTAAIFRQIADTTGSVPKVGVLSVAADGRCRFFYDTEGGHMDIGVDTVGLRISYFTLAQIDPPPSVLEELATRAKWEKLLEHGATFELSFLEADFGFPCPDNLRAVEEAIALALTDAGIARVGAVDYRERGGRHYETLRIDVADRHEGARRIADLMRKLCAPASTTLTQVASHGVALRDAVVDMALKPKDELVAQHTNRIVQDIVRETVRCCPPGWTGCTLAIGTDGSWLDYRLTSGASRERPFVSSTLKKLCEDLCVLMWLQEDRWTQATLSLTELGPSPSFKLDFGYDAPPVADRAARAIADEAIAKAAAAPLATLDPAPAKPWWRVW